jgi:hypothetical protein
MPISAAPKNSSENKKSDLLHERKKVKSTSEPKLATISAIVPQSVETTELLKIFKSKDKTKINEIIAKYGYPSLKEIQSEVENMPAGAFVEDPEGVLRNTETTNQNILLTFDICSNYKGESERNVVEFINNVANKRPAVPVILFVTGNALSNPRIRAAIEEASQYNHVSIQNHGYNHTPLSTTPGREIYNIKGAKSIEDAYYEVVQGSILTESITGKKPKYYRSSTLYADSRGVKIAKMLGLEMLGRTSKKRGDRLKPGTEKAGDIVLRHAKYPSSIHFVNDVRERIRRGKLNLARN